jgi:acetyl esterase/lipase
MRKFWLSIGRFVAFLGILTLLKFPTRFLCLLKAKNRHLGDGLTLLFVPFLLLKIITGIFSPFIALLGSLTTLMACIWNDLGILLSGLTGVVLTLRHLTRVTQEHNHFTQTFGADWEAHIPESLRARMAPARWQFPLAIPASVGVQVTRDVIIGRMNQTREPLLTDLWEPPKGVSRTGIAVIHMHSTAWQALDKGMLMNYLFRRLARQGHLIMDLAYPLAPTANLNQMIKQVKRAILWMKDNAERFGINSERIVLMGGSGGGHLALLAGYTPNYTPFQPDNNSSDTSVRAVIAVHAMTDLVTFFEEYGVIEPRQPEYSFEVEESQLARKLDKTHFDRWLTEKRIWPQYRYQNMPGGALLLVGMLGGTLKERRKAYEEASPIYYVSADCPPTLQFFGTHDFYFLSSHGRRLHEALLEVGAVSIYVEFPQTDHGFNTFFPRVAPAAQAAAYDIERFLALLI